MALSNRGGANFAVNVVIKGKWKRPAMLNVEKAGFIFIASAAGTGCLNLLNQVWNNLFG
tara:strand:- start:240 stop:416 length:177 start_codon:yes stop_codon:yes gene_type:complete